MPQPFKMSIICRFPPLLIYSYLLIIVFIYKKNAVGNDDDDEKYNNTIFIYVFNYFQLINYNN